MPIAGSYAERNSQGIAGIFANRKIGTKIFVGFALVLAITIGISVTAYTTFASVEDSFKTYSQRVTVVGLARDIDREFLAYRRFVREYAVTGEEANVVAAEKGRALLSGIVSNALGQIKNPERLAQTKQLSDRFALYSAAFDKLVGFRRELDKVTKEVLDPTGLKLRTDLEELQGVTVDFGHQQFPSASRRSNQAGDDSAAECK